ncbi:MAG: biotin/lipoyl-containing protein [Eubacteriales bacterium]
MKKYIVTVNGTKYEVLVEEGSPVSSPAAEKVQDEPKKTAPPAPAAKPADTVSPAGGTKVNAPLPGNVLKVNFSVGQVCKKGDILCILEAMKMENEILSPVDGKVVTAAASGATVNTGDLLFVIE